MPPKENHYPNCTEEALRLFSFSVLAAAATATAASCVASSSSSTTISTHFLLSCSSDCRRNCDSLLENLDHHQLPPNRPTDPTRDQYLDTLYRKNSKIPQKDWKLAIIVVKKNYKLRRRCSFVEKQQQQHQTEEHQRRRRRRPLII